jgi:hydrogenase-4 component B
MLVPAAACVSIGLAPTLFWRPLAHAVSAWRPELIGLPLPAPLAVVGWVDVGLVTTAGMAAASLWWWVRRRGWRRAPTWDCGYVLPTARMQYTAGSFAATINEWFAWILRPVRTVRRPDGPFPDAAALDEHTPETVLERVIEPGGRAVTFVAMAARRLQHGRLQAYLFYVLIGLAVVGGLVLAGGDR